MATSEAYTAGIIPAVNDLVAIVAVVGAYITRFGVLAEGASAWWHLPLFLTTDFLLPLLAGVWFVGVPVYRSVRNC
jgi:hypothetical protein